MGSFAVGSRELKTGSSYLGFIDFWTLRAGFLLFVIGGKCGENDRAWKASLKIQ